MSRGMRLMIMMLVVAGIITMMMQCAKRSMTHRKAASPPQDGMAPGPRPNLA